MKLLFVFRKLDKGGIATTIINRLNYLSENTDFEIHVVSELKNNSEMVLKVNSEIKFHILDLNSIISKKRIPIFGHFFLIEEVKVKYQEFIDFLKPDIITSFNFGYNAKIIPYLESNAFKVIELRGSFASRRNLKKHNLRYYIFNFFQKNSRFIHNEYDYAITTTKEDSDDRKYLKVEKITIYNPHRPPINTTEFKNRNNTIIAVGTLTQNKNFKDLIKASYLIKENLLNWKIHIYGDGEQQDYLTGLINKYSLSEIISLKEFSYDMQKVYNESKLLISTSLSEGFGNTILEALSYKIPVISYNCKCGPKEIIEDNVNGFLIEFDYKILAKKIKYMVENENKLNEFSENTFLSLTKFEYKRIMQEWEGFYLRLYNKAK